MEVTVPSTHISSCDLCPIRSCLWEGRPLSWPSTRLHLLGPSSPQYTVPLCRLRAAGMQVVAGETEGHCSLD